MSNATDPDELLRLFVEYVRCSVDVQRAMVLSSKGLTAPQYRIVLRLEWDDGAWTESVAKPDDLRAGGLLADLLHRGTFRSITDLRPEPSDAAYELLRGSHTLIAFPLFEEGISVGAVVMLGPSPQTCDETGLCALAIMSALLDRASSAQTLARRLGATCQALDAELEAAADVQRWLLPRSLPAIAGISLEASYQTARRSGGDYYDWVELADGRLGVLIADVSGKGAPAAVLMSVLRTIMHDMDLPRMTGPAAFLDYADRRLCELGLPQRQAFVTAFACALNPTTGALTYSSAGHNPPRWLRAHLRTVVPLDGASTPPLGMFDEPSAHTEETIFLAPGDLALLYTDGITEAGSPQGEFFGVERVDEVLRELHGPVTPAAALQAITTAVSHFAGAAPLADDQTLLALGRPQSPPTEGDADEHV